jgi:hypothetical protein
MVELMCNGTFEDKDPNEAIECLDLLAESHVQECRSNK